MRVKEGVSEWRAQQTLSWNLKVKHDRLLGQKLRQEPFLPVSNNRKLSAYQGFTGEVEKLYQDRKYGGEKK